MLKKLVAHNIRRARTEERLSQKDLAVKVGVHLNQIGKWEAAKTSPEYENMEALAAALNREPSWFFVPHNDNPESEVVTMPRLWAKKLTDLYKGMTVLNPATEPLPLALTQF